MGTVAYTGYTASAKKNASKTLHSQAAKYIAAEIQKCSLDSGSTAMDDLIDCDATTGATDEPTGQNYADAYDDNSNDKNPYLPANDGVVVSAAGTDEGTLYLTVSGDDITLSMVPKDGDPAITTKVTVE